MTEDFKKWLCELTGYSIFIDTNKECNLIALLIKAMWAINREGKCYIQDDTYAGRANSGFVAVVKKKYGAPDFKRFFVSENNNSETEALIKALEYIYKQEAL